MQPHKITGKNIYDETEVCGHFYLKGSRLKFKIMWYQLYWGIQAESQYNTLKKEFVSN